MGIVEWGFLVFTHVTFVVTTVAIQPRRFSYRIRTGNPWQDLVGISHYSKEMGGGGGVKGCFLKQVFMKCTWKILSSDTAQKKNIYFSIFFNDKQRNKFSSPSPSHTTFFYKLAFSSRARKDHKDKRDRKECREHVMTWYGKI